MFNGQQLTQKALWFALAAAIYLYLMGRPIDHFWAFASLLPFFIKIVYGGEPSVETPTWLDAAKLRMVVTNNTMLVPAAAILLASAFTPKVIPFVLAFVLVTDVVAYLNPGAARAIARSASWIPEALR